MLNFQARFILDPTSLTPEAFKDELGFVILWFIMCEKFALLPQIPTSCCGVGNVTCVKRANVVSCLAKCLLKLELIDGPGVIPKGRAGRRKAQVLLVIWQGNLQALGLWKALLCQLALLLGRLHCRERGQLIFIGYANSDLTKCQDQMQQKSPKSVCCHINQEWVRFLKAQVSAPAEPPEMRWLAHGGHPELVASEMYVHGPNDSGTGHAVSPGGKHLIQMGSWWFDGITELLCSARSLLAAQRLLWSSPWCPNWNLHWNQWPSVRTLNKIKLCPEMLQ